MSVTLALASTRSSVLASRMASAISFRRPDCWSSARTWSGRVPRWRAIWTIDALSSASLTSMPRSCARRARMKNALRRLRVSSSLAPRISARRCSTCVSSRPFCWSWMRAISRLRATWPPDIFSGSSRVTFSSSHSAACSRMAARCSWSRRDSSESLTCSRRFSTAPRPRVVATASAAAGSMRSACAGVNSTVISAPRRSSRSWTSGPVVFRTMESPTFLPVSLAPRSSNIRPRTWPLPSSSASGTTTSVSGDSKYGSCLEPFTRTVALPTMRSRFVNGPSMRLGVPKR